MRILFVLLAAAPLAFGHSTHRTHIVNTTNRTEVRLIRESGGESSASFRRDGVRYVTTDPSVIAEIEKAMARQRDLSQEHSRLGRKHSDLGREHSRLGREYSRLGREASRHGETADIERQRRALEAEQRKLDEKQRQLEGEERALDERQRAAEVDTNRSIEQIFTRAVREGKARRE